MTKSVWLNRLTKTRMLWFLFMMTIVLTVGFALVMKVWDFKIIDEIYDPALVLSHIGSLSAKQKMVHIWMTATLDVAYPFVYGGLFIGMALRYFGRFGPWLAAPSIAVIIVDLMEGVTQILLLSGNDQYAGVKAILTPLKLGLFFFGLVVTVIAAVMAMWSFFSKKRNKG